MMYIRGYYTDEPEYKERRVEKKTEKELVSMDWLEYQQVVKDISTRKQMQAFIDKRMQIQANRDE